jgi:hypothetical protein
MHWAVQYQGTQHHALEGHSEDKATTSWQLGFKQLPRPAAAACSASSDQLLAA